MASAWLVLWRRVRTGDPVAGAGSPGWWAPGGAPSPGRPLRQSGRLALRGRGQTGPERSGRLPSGVAARATRFWTMGVDAQWATRPSLYGPGALDLSALFVRISGGRPWVAAECWRLTAVVGLVLCGWGVHRIAPSEAATPLPPWPRWPTRPFSSSSSQASTTTPSCSVSPWPASLWSCSDGRPRRGPRRPGRGREAQRPSRSRGPGLVGVGKHLAPTGDGNPLGRRRRHGRPLSAASAPAGPSAGCRPWPPTDGYPGPWSLGPRFLGAESGRPQAIEWAGVALAVLLVMGCRRSGRWITGLGSGLAVLALDHATPEPWYLSWAVVLLAAGGSNTASSAPGSSFWWP